MLCCAKRWQVQQLGLKLEVGGAAASLGEFDEISYEAVKVRLVILMLGLHLNEIN